jgi:hypothetical protein
MGVGLEKAELAAHGLRKKRSDTPQNLEVLLEIYPTPWNEIF